ncbi:MAG TPA: hypothetical protein VIT88_09875 [Pyrinomonadaceae bacterium]
MQWRKALTPSPAGHIPDGPTRVPLLDRDSYFMRLDELNFSVVSPPVKMEETTLARGGEH